MWAELFVFGTLWFWLLVGIAAFWILMSVAREWGTGATTCLIILTLILWLFGDINIFKLTYQHPIHALLVVLGYYAVGLCWALWKWYLAICHIRSRFERLCNRYQTDIGLRYDHGAYQTRTISLEEFINHRNSELSCGDIQAGAFDGTPESLAPKVKESVDSIVFWMTYWPFGLFWALTHDLLEKIGRFLTTQYRILFEKIAKRVLGRISIPITAPVENKNVVHEVQQ